MSLAQNGFQWSSAQNIPEYFQVTQVSPWILIGFPEKKKLLDCSTEFPHACIYLEKFPYIFGKKEKHHFNPPLIIILLEI